METLIQLYRKKIALTDTSFIRSLEHEINWSARLICIRGARGTGKTTMMLQHIKLHFEDDLSKALYVSLDNLYFSSHSLLETAAEFARRGGTHLFLDEVHKYPDWSQIITNLYDDYPELSVVYTGSSLLEILNARADLSRRALVYEMQGLSFREYIAMKEHIILPSYSLEQILSENEKISSEIVSQIKPFAYFENYLRFGYYPFFMEGEDDYYSRLNESVNMTLEIELPLLRNVEIGYVAKIKRLLGIIGSSVPFIPNVTELASLLGIARQTLLTYFQYLADGKLIALLYKDSRGLNALSKPDKILLDNPNIMFLLSQDKADKGSVRESFVRSQLSYHHKVMFSENSDFFVDDTWTFEVGGRNKKRTQIEHISNSYIIADDIEYGTDRRIPIWLLGFMY
ncbi:MAG: AAA family ATPase [Spirochaetales bacterium]|nr:AAA family ATPase [Spirochaetales bacterium]